MTLGELYELLRARFGARSDPDTWWPIYYGRTDPPAFERAITNILVQNSLWDHVYPDVTRLDQGGFLTARTLAHADPQTVASCIQKTGLQNQKAPRLIELGQLIVGRFGSEATFCTRVAYADLRSIKGIGAETADRTLLYTCGRLMWPVDTYSVKVLSHYGVIPPVADPAAAKKSLTPMIKQMVEREMPSRLADWQRLHALMQLAGAELGTRPSRRDP
jgi:endonuclease-3 related protein